MPIVRTYQCVECFHRMEITLDGNQWDDAPPDCPACARRVMAQEFKPINIGGSTRARAVKLAETIAAEDYHVADMNVEGREGGTPKVRFKDQTPQTSSTWGAAGAALEQAMAAGRQTRLQHGSGLDILQRALKSGDQPDLIEQSKKRMMRIY